MRIEGLEQAVDVVGVCPEREGLGPGVRGRVVDDREPGVDPTPSCGLAAASAAAPGCCWSCRLPLIAGAPFGLRIFASRSVSKSRRALISSSTGSLRMTLTRTAARRKTPGGSLGSGAGGRSGCGWGGGSGVGVGRVARETARVAVSAGSA